MLRSLFVLTALFLLAAVVVGVGSSMSLFLACICGLIAVCLWHKKKVEIPAGTARPIKGAGFSYHLCSVGVLYLIPIALATAFYIFLSLYVAWYGDTLHLESLIMIQQSFEGISRFFSDNLKLTEGRVLVVLVLVYLLSCLLLWHHKSSIDQQPDSSGLRLRKRLVLTLQRAVDGYVKYTGPIAAGLATLASLTLFGMQLGEPTKDLQLRIKVLQVGYADVTRRTEAALTERVTGELYREIHDALPPFYLEALQLPTQIDGSVEDVRQHADSAKSRHGVTVPAVEQMLQEQTSRMEKVDKLASDLRVEGTGRQSVPASTTEKEVTTARNALNSRPSEQRIDLITEGQKKVTLQIEKLVTERIVALTKPLMEAVPILEPLVQSFVEAADKTLQERIEKSYERAVQVAMQNPGELDAVIEREARSIVAETNAKALAERAAPGAQQKSEQLRQTISWLAASKPDIDKAVAEHLARQPKPDPRRGILVPLPDMYYPPYTYQYYPPHTYQYRPPYTGGYDQGRLTPSRPITPPRPAPRAPGRFFW